MEFPRDAKLLVFQYGSNIDQTRLNGSERLGGSAELVGLAETMGSYELMFNVWSVTQQHAVANLVRGSQNVFGALYRVPDYRIFRNRKRDGLRTFDEIEGEGSTYKRVSIEVLCDGQKVDALTYVGKTAESPEKATKPDYAEHIIAGLESLRAPLSYIQYVKQRIADSLALAD